MKMVKKGTGKKALKFKKKTGKGRKLVPKRLKRRKVNRKHLA